MSKEELERLFEYKEGHLYWKVTRGKAIKGMKAGTRHARGYIMIRVNGKRYLEHRLIWIMFNGEIPKHLEIDHIWHIKHDNNPLKLRVITHKDDCKNVGKKKNNTTGITGVTWHKMSSKWQAHITVNGTKLYLGCYEHFDDAVAARLEAENKYGFHINHGK